MKFILLFILFFSCVDKSSPDAVLKSFLKLRFSDKQKRSKIIGYLTGNLYKKINGLSDIEFNEYISVSNYSLKRIFFNMKNCSNNKCYITYTISYYKKDKNDNNIAIVETKKIVEMRLINDNWKLADIENLKTHIDSKKIAKDLLD